MVSSLHRSWLSSPNTNALFPSNSARHPGDHSFRLSLSFNRSNDEPSRPTDSQSQDTLSESTQNPVDPVKLAFERAKKYKESIKSNSALANEKRLEIAMETARQYKENQAAGAKNGQSAETDLTRLKDVKLPDEVVDKKDSKKESLAISSIDFVGLDFGDKKMNRGLPPGLVPLTDPFSEGDFPEVEIIVGDASKFGQATTSEPKPTTEDDTGLYKPKVSTWGVFPRPNNISKTFGGGRTIRPGDVIETEEDKAAKEKRTRELLAAYKKKRGLSIDPKLKSECEKALEDGDSLMNSGKLKEAIPYYEKVMKQMDFQSELHGLAALQWAICQDSLNRPDVARPMYQKLQSHPTAKISKKATHFAFSFQAMKMMKVTGPNPLLENKGYQNYFEAFVEDKPNYPLEADEVNSDVLSQALPYFLFLVSPIFMVLFIAIKKGYAN